MSINHSGPVAPVRLGRPGAHVALAVVLWVVVGWPLSWLLLFGFFPLGILFGVAITVLMVVYLATPRPVVVAVGPPALAPEHQVIRREVEGLAHINAVGGCGWCGSPWAHANDAGYHVHPRHWHAAEIEERIRSKILR